MSSSKLFIALDPGTAYTGVALFDEKVNAPIAVRLLRAPKQMGFEARTEAIAASLNNFIRYEAGKKAKELFIEQPEYRDNAGGAMVARRGDLGKLMWCAGVYGGIGMARGLDVSLVPINHWKGQLSKDNVERRIRRLLGDKACGDFKADIWDAVGIGLYVKELF